MKTLQFKQRSKMYYLLNIVSAFSVILAFNLPLIKQAQRPYWENITRG